MECGGLLRFLFFFTSERKKAVQSTAVQRKAPPFCGDAMSETSLWSQSVAAFRDATASAEPTPGGGSVAMVSASLGLGLVIMALEISARKPAAGTETELADLLARARKLLDALGRHADEDVAVFRNLMSSYKLPKQTDEDKAARTRAIQEATAAATRAPLKAAGDAVAALELAERAVTLAKGNVVSDVGAGAALLGGAVAAVLLNVDINLPGLSDAALKDHFSRERATLAGQASALAADVLLRVAGRIATGK